MPYAPTPPTPKDRVRLLLGDTDGSDELLTDAEIEALLALTPDPQLAAAAGAEALAARFGRRVDTSLPGGVRIAFSQRAEAFRLLAHRLRGDVAVEPAAASTGEGAEGRCPIFQVGMHDVPGQ